MMARYLWHRRHHHHNSGSNLHVCWGWHFSSSRIHVQVTIYRRLLIGRDGLLDQSEAYDISYQIVKHEVMHNGVQWNVTKSVVLRIYWHADCGLGCFYLRVSSHLTHAMPPRLSLMEQVSGRRGPPKANPSWRHTLPYWADHTGNHNLLQDAFLWANTVFLQSARYDFQTAVPRNVKHRLDTMLSARPGWTCCSVHVCHCSGVLPGRCTASN